MMLLYAIRSLLRSLTTLRRRMKKAPDYVVLELEGDYPDIVPPVSNPILRRLRQQQTSLRDIAHRLRTIRDDERVTGVVLLMRPLSMPGARLDATRDLLAELKDAGKRIEVWTHTLDRPTLYVASSADAIYLLPGGWIQPLGVAREYQYLGDALDAIGVKGDFVAISPYNSAADPITRSSMSDAVREMVNWLTDSSFQHVLDAIAEGRGMSPGDVQAGVDASPLIDTRALELGVIDGILTQEEQPQVLQRDAEEPPRLLAWDAARRVLLPRPLPRRGKYVAVMTIEGVIMDGKSQQPPVDPPVPVPFVSGGQAGDQSVVRAARRIAQDDRAAAAVLWVDSRGGSATASESMRAALAEVAARKPLVVVMGSIAASGGYWVATPGQTIIAQPNTITGSIGVIAGKLAIGGLLDRLRIRRELITRGENATLFNSDDPFTQEERAQMRAYIQRTYDLFLERVSASRAMPVDAVDAVSGGRVWTGKQALENGLVDALGGLDDGLKKARELANLPENSRVRLVTPGREPVLPKPQEKSAAWLAQTHQLLKAINAGLPLAILPWMEDV
ncbi:MAG: signal peptide peptidase SppA [Anaerolineae bacterium]